MNTQLKKLYDEYLAAGVEPVAAVALAVAEMPPRIQPPYTVPEIAALLRVRHMKVLAWIHSGQLKAFNVAEKQGGRPRYRIHRQDFDDFVTCRSVVVVAKPRVRKQAAPLVWPTLPKAKVGRG